MQKGWMSVGLALVLAGCGGAKGITASTVSGAAVQAQKVGAGETRGFTLTNPIVEKLVNQAGILPNGHNYPVSAFFRVLGQAVEGRFEILIEHRPGRDGRVIVSGELDGRNVILDTPAIKIRLAERLRSAQLSPKGVVYEQTRQGGVIKAPEWSQWRFFMLVQPMPSYGFPEVPEETSTFEPRDRNQERDIRKLLNGAAAVLQPPVVRRPAWTWPTPGYPTDQGVQ